MYPDKDLLFWGKDTPKLEFSSFASQFYPLKRIFFSENYHLSKIELEVRKWKITLFLKNGYFLILNCDILDFCIQS